jgi:hypothetical protein
MWQMIGVLAELETLAYLGPHTRGSEVRAAPGREARPGVKLTPIRSTRPKTSGTYPVPRYTARHSEPAMSFTTEGPTGNSISEKSARVAAANRGVDVCFKSQNQN